MKFVKYRMLLLVVCFAFATISLSAQNITEVVVDIDKSSMPEGIAIDPETGNIYVSSIHLDKITRSDNNGNNTIDVITSGQEGYTFGTGMMIVKNNLFACGRIGREHKPVILQIDMSNNTVINTFRLPDDVSAIFNDITVDNDFNAYMTDSEYSRIYRLDYKSGKINLFLEGEGMDGPNGICISDDQTKLYLNSNSEGIRIFDIASKKLLNPKHDETSDKGIDGLKYHNNNLYVVYNYGGREIPKQGLMKFALSDNGEKIMGSQELTIGHDKNVIPTTVGIYDGHAYYIANSQFNNLNWGDNTIKTPTTLTDTYVLKVDIGE